MISSFIMDRLSEVPVNNTQVIAWKVRNVWLQVLGASHTLLLHLWEQSVCSRTYLVRFALKRSSVARNRCTQPLKRECPIRSCELRFSTHLFKHFVKSKDYNLLADSIVISPIPPPLSFALLILSRASSFPLFHIAILDKWARLKLSLHHFSNLGRGLPFPFCGSPAIFLTSSKYSSKSGYNAVNGTPSPLYAILSSSHLICSLVGGRVIRPARNLATNTACHSKTLNVN